LTIAKRVGHDPYTMNHDTLKRILLAVLCCVFVACGDDDFIPGGEDSGPGDDGGNAGRGGGGRGGSGGRGGIPPRDAGMRDSGEDDAGRDSGGGDEDSGNPGCTRDADCDDDDACTDDSCDNGVCSNDDIDIDDNDACTTDSCDEDTGVSHVAVNTDDSNACTTDSCAAATGVSHVMIAIDDNDMCTTDACDTATGNVTHVAVSIDDSDMCTTDSCAAATGVAHTPVSTDDSDMCTIDSCDPATGVAHTPVSTDDNDMCTADSCVPATGVVHAPISPDDADGCTTDACSPLTGVSNTPVSVDDSDGCTTDSCTSPAGTINHVFCTSNMCDTGNTCLNQATTTVNQTTPTAIPTGPAVVTSTLVVAGAGTRIWDVNLRTTITHTFAADMDISLTSPAGTVVTLSTDNGAGNDNVFNGTTWDDDADADGMLPYVTNAGLATDHAYVNLTTATPLVPEEALGAFIGEDPNGTWTLTISDDLAGDGGNVVEWGVDIVTISAAPTVAVQTTTQSTATPIADVALSSSTLVVPAATGIAICSLTVNTDITHSFAADMDITLTSPAGTIVTLTTDNGAGNDNVFISLWDDDANPAGTLPYVTNSGVASDHAYVNLTAATPIVPEEALSAFIGENPNGTWTLTVSDDLAGDTGSINSWALNIGRCLRAP
jgi:subtilisin-like proprotein convertase family protein